VPAETLEAGASRSKTWASSPERVVQKPGESQAEFSDSCKERVESRTCATSGQLQQRNASAEPAAKRGAGWRLCRNKGEASHRRGGKEKGEL